MVADENKPPLALRTDGPATASVEDLLLPVASFLGLPGREEAPLPEGVCAIAGTVQTACARRGVHSLADPKWDAATTLICDIGTRGWHLADLDHGKQSARVTH